MYEGFRKYLEFEDIYKLPEWLTCEYMLPSFLKPWTKEEATLKEANKNRRDPNSTDSHRKEASPWPLIKAIVKSTGWSYGLAIAYRVVTMIIIYFNPIILG